MLAGCVLVAGCGGDDGDGKGSDGKRSRLNLDRPIHARCGTEGFAKPRITPVGTGDEGGNAWSLHYSLSPAGKRKAKTGDTTTMLIVEFSPDAPKPKQSGGLQKIVVAGRQVELRPAGGRARVSLAQWKTKRATYTGVADGRKPTTLKRFIACMP